MLAAAYLARASADADVDALSEADLLRALLDEHEAGHWDRWDKRRDLGLDPADQRAAVAVATLLTADGEDEALTVARLIPHLGGEPESRLIAIARWLAQLYPPPEKPSSLSSPRSNPTGSARSWSATSSGSTRACWPRRSTRHQTRQLARALTVAGRIARDDQAVNAQLRAALDDRLADLFQRGLNADGSDLLTAVTTAMTTSRPARGAADAADRFPDVLPVWLRPLAVTVTALAVDGLRAQASDDPAAIPDLARWLNNLANRLSDVGQREEALETAREAVTLYRQLAQASPAAYLPDLAVSLNNLATFLSDVGQRQEALETAREAVTIRRQLAQANPDAYLPDLATSLNNLANRLGEVGQREEALETAREAVTLRPAARPGQSRRLPPRPGHVAEQPRQLPQRCRPAAGGAGDGPRGRHPLPAARPGQSRRLPPRPGHVAEQPRQLSSARPGSGRRRWRRPARPSPSTGSSPRPVPTPTSPTWPCR